MERIVRSRSLSAVVGFPDDVLRSANSRSSRSDALRAVLGLWVGEPEMSALLQDLEDDQTFFRIAARHNGLQIFRFGMILTFCGSSTCRLFWSFACPAVSLQGTWPS
jgi:hypothetical protein